jgi:hypothetical protein
MPRRPRRVHRSGYRDLISGPSVDMNRPGSPEYTQRHRRFSIEIAPGMKRVDIGAPTNAPGREPAKEECAGEPSAVLPAEPKASPAPAPSDPMTERNWKSDFGLSKGD